MRVRPSTRLSCLCCPAWAQPKGPARQRHRTGFRPRGRSANNLQDRYEISVIHRTTKPWACLAGVEFSTRRPDVRRMAAWAGHVLLERRGGRVDQNAARRRGRRLLPTSSPCRRRRASGGYFPGVIQKTFAPAAATSASRCQRRTHSITVDLSTLRSLGSARPAFDRPSWLRGGERTRTARTLPLSLRASRALYAI